jgi:hypothetical protein
MRGQCVHYVNELDGATMRVFAVDLSRCPHCGGQLRVIAVITDPGVISRILQHMGLDGRVQPRAPPLAVAN